MRLLAAITDPAVATRILTCMRLPARAPPLEPPVPHEPITAAWEEDASPADFDQTLPEDWDTGA